MKAERQARLELEMRLAMEETKVAADAVRRSQADARAEGVSWDGQFVLYAQSQARARERKAIEAAAEGYTPLLDDVRSVYKERGPDIFLQAWRVDRDLKNKGMESSVEAILKGALWVRRNPVGIRSFAAFRMQYYGLRALKGLSHESALKRIDEMGSFRGEK